MSGLPEDGVDELVWLVVYRNGPIARDDLSAQTKLCQEDLSLSLERLESARRVVRSGGEAGDLYSSKEFFVPLGQAIGWEAAVLDHFQAVVRTICRRLELGAPTNGAQAVGGSTYTFDVWPGHPFEEEVHSTLAEYRQRASALRQRVEAHNADHGLPLAYTEVVAYAGQCALPRGPHSEREEPEK